MTVISPNGHTQRLLIPGIMTIAADGKKSLTMAALLWPSQDGTGLQDAMLTSLARACEAIDDTMDDYADECRTLIWPLTEQDYASRPESQKTELGPQKKVIRIEGRTINGVLKAFKHKRILDDTFHPIPNTFPGGAHVS